MKRSNLNIILTFVALGSLAYGGFEIGNGRKLITNESGNYSIIVPDRLEIGKFNRLTEAISPISEGTPRAKLQINIIKNTEITSLEQLIDSRPDATWTPITLAGLSGIRKDEILPTKLHQVEIRLFSKANEMIVINLEGLPQGTVSSSYFERIENSLETFQLAMEVDAAAQENAKEAAKPAAACPSCSPQRCHSCGHRPNPTLFPFFNF